MRGLVGVIIAVIALVFVGAAFYYWGGVGTPAAEPVEGVVVNKTTRMTRTEVDGNELRQGIRVLSGQTAGKERFFVLQIRTQSGDTRDITVSQAFFQQVAVGDTVRQYEPDGVATVVSRAARAPWGGQPVQRQPVQRQPPPLRR